MPPFAEVLRRQSRELSKLEGAQASEFLRLVREAKDMLLGRFDAAARSTDPLDAFRMRSLIAEAEGAIKTLEYRAGQKFAGAQAGAVELGADHLAEEVDHLAAAFEAEPLAVDVSAQVALADPVQGLLANQFETSVQQYGLETLNAVRRDMFVGLRAGDSVGDVIKAVRGRMGALGDSSPLWKTERLVRTEMSHAYNSAHQSGFEAIAETTPDVRKKWVHLGATTATHPCPVCSRLDGTTKPVNGTWTVTIGKRTREIAHPPAHPWCDCRSVLDRPKWRS